MKRSRFTEEQIIKILHKQEAGRKEPDLCSINKQFFDISIFATDLLLVLRATQIAPSSY